MRETRFRMKTPGESCGAREVADPLERLAIEGAGDARRLAGIDPPEYRLRVGKWRIRFQIDHVGETLDVLHVLRRDEAY